MTQEQVAVMCDEVADKYMRAWNLGREAQDKPGGPDWEEVDDLLHKAFDWHDLAEKLRGSKP